MPSSLPGSGPVTPETGQEPPAAAPVATGPPPDSSLAHERPVPMSDEDIQILAAESAQGGDLPPSTPVSPAPAARPGPPTPAPASGPSAAGPLFASSPAEDATSTSPSSGGASTQRVSAGPVNQPPRASPHTPTPSSRGVVVKTGGYSSTAGAWCLIMCPSYGKDKIFLNRGRLQGLRLRTGVSVTFRPTGNTETLGGERFPGATPPAVCKAISADAFDWFPGTYKRVHSGSNTTFMIEFCYPADNTRNAPVKKSQLNLPAAAKFVRPGSPILFQATLNSEGAVALLPKGIKPNTAALRTSVANQVSPELLRQLPVHVILGGLAGADFRLPHQACLENIHDKYCGPITRSNPLDDAYKVLTNATARAYAAASPSSLPTAALAYDPDADTPIHILVLPEGAPVYDWHGSINRCFTTTRAPLAFVKRARIRLAVAVDTQATPTNISSTASLAFCHDQYQFTNHAFGLELEQGVTQLFRQTMGTTTPYRTRYLPSQNTTRFLHILYDATPHSSYEGNSGVPGMLHQACQPTMLFSGLRNSTSASPPGSTVPPTPRALAGHDQEPPPVVLAPQVPVNPDGVIVCLPKFGDLLRPLEDAVRLATDGRAHMAPFHIPSGDLTGVLITRTGCSSQDLARAINDLPPLSTKFHRSRSYRFHAMTLAAYLSPNNYCLWAGDGHRIPIEDLRSLFGGAPCIQNGSRSWLLHAPSFDDGAVAAGLRAFNQALEEAAAKSPTAQLGRRQQPIKAFTHNHTVTWLTPFRPQPTTTRAWTTATTHSLPRSRNTHTLHGIPAGTAHADIIAILDALKVDPAWAFWYQTRNGSTGIEVDLPDDHTPPLAPVFIGFHLVCLSPAPSEPRQRLHPIHETHPPPTVIPRLRESLSTLYAVPPMPGMDKRGAAGSAGGSGTSASTATPSPSAQAAATGLKAMQEARAAANKAAAAARGKNALSSQRRTQVPTTNPLAPVPLVPPKKLVQGRGTGRGGGSGAGRGGAPPVMGGGTSGPNRHAVAPNVPASSPAATPAATPDATPRPAGLIGVDGPVGAHVTQSSSGSSSSRPVPITPPLKVTQSSKQAKRPLAKGLPEDLLHPPSGACDGYGNLLLSDWRLDIWMEEITECFHGGRDGNTLSVTWAYAPPEEDPVPIGECHIPNKDAASYNGYDKAVAAWEALGEAGRKGTRKRPCPETPSVFDYFAKTNSTSAQGSQVNGGALPPPKERPDPLTFTNRFSVLTGPALDSPTPLDPTHQGGDLGAGTHGRGQRKRGSRSRSPSKAVTPGDRSRSPSPRGRLSDASLSPDTVDSDADTVPDHDTTVVIPATPPPTHQ